MIFNLKYNISNIFKNKLFLQFNYNINIVYIKKISILFIFKLKNKLFTI